MFLVGSPEDRPDLFVWSAGHGHYHLKDFNEFKLFNTSGEGVVIGHKQAFCLMDWSKVDRNARPDPQFTDCNTVSRHIRGMGGPLRRWPSPASIL